MSENRQGGGYAAAFASVGALIAAVALAALLYVIVATASEQTGACGTVRPAEKFVGGCVEFWIERYQSLIGSLIATTAAAVAARFLIKQVGLQSQALELDREIRLQQRFVELSGLISATKRLRFELATSASQVFDRFFGTRTSQRTNFKLIASSIDMLEGTLNRTWAVDVDAEILADALERIRTYVEEAEARVALLERLQSAGTLQMSKDAYELHRHNTREMSNEALYAGEALSIAISPIVAEARRVEAMGKPRSQRNDD